MGVGGAKESGSIPKAHIYRALAACTCISIVTMTTPNNDDFEICLVKGDGEDSPAKAGQDPYISSQGGNKLKKLQAL